MNEIPSSLGEPMLFMLLSLAQDWLNSKHVRLPLYVLTLI